MDCQFGLVSRDDTVARNQLSPCGRAPSEASGYFQVLQAHRQSPILGSFESVPEVRVLSSAGITRPHRSYDPVRLPARPAVLATALEVRPQAGTGLPRLPGPPFQRAVPNTPVDRNGCLCRLLPHSTRPSPFPRRVGIHDFTFEACSDFTRVTARWIAQPPKAAFVTRLRDGRLPNRPARQLPDQPTTLWMVLPPLVIRAIGAHVESRRGAVAEAMRHRSVFSPRSSNRTCGFTASGSPTGFTSRHTVDCQFGLVSRDDTVARNQLSPCGRAPSEASGYFQVLQAHRQSPILGSFESVPEVRVLSSAGITRPHRSYDPVRLPPGRRARHGVGGATSGRNGPPPITRTTFPTCRAQYPGGSERVPMSVASPFHAAFPVSQAGRHPRFHFRGLLRLHSRYGPLDRSTAQGGLCHEASRRPVTQPPRSSATRSTDNSVDGTFLHW